jgi:hypothetical protein
MDAFFCKLIRIGFIIDLTRNIVYFRKDVELSATVSFLLYSRSIFGIRKQLLDSVETPLLEMPIDKQGAFSPSSRTSIIYIYLFWLEITLKILGAPTAQPDVSLIITYDSHAADEVVLLESFESVKKMLDQLASVGDHAHSCCRHLTYY